MVNESIAQMFKDGVKAWACLFIACFAWLFGGSFRQALAAAANEFFPRPESERVDEATDLISRETEELMAALERAPEDDVMVARRFLRGEMTADLSTLGTATANRVLAIRVQGLDHEAWSDGRLRSIMGGRVPEVLNKRVMRRIAEDLDWGHEPAVHAI